MRVPTIEQERLRSLTRQRGALLKERQRCIVRGFGLMLAQGVHAPEGWWELRVWHEFVAELPAWLRPHVAWWQGSIRAGQGFLFVVRAEGAPWTSSDSKAVRRRATWVRGKRRVRERL